MIEAQKFENTGIQHEHNPQIGHSCTRQDHYVLELSEIDTQGLETSLADEHCNEEMHERYRILLGALA
eukprot:12928385-Prorocentrum_lima.AAC.1